MFFSDEVGIELTFLGPWHLLQIFITGLVIFLIIRYKERIRESQYENILRYVIGSTLIVIEVSYYIWKGYMGTLTFVNGFPLGVCAINILVSIYIIFSKNEKVFNIIYFWGLGAILSILFPDMLFGPDRYRYYQFFYAHIFFLWIYMYMIFVHGYRPNLKDFRNSAVLLFVVAVGVALPLSFVLDYNFMFMLNAGGTPLVILEPLGQVVYVIGTVIVMAIVMAIYYSPIYIFVIRKDKKSS